MRLLSLSLSLSLSSLSSLLLLTLTADRSDLGFGSLFLKSLVDTPWSVH